MKTVVLTALALALCLTARGGEAAPPRNATGQEVREAPTRKQIDTAIQAGLAWLAEMQVPEGPEAGSWEAPAFKRAAASFSGLAFLANGYRPGEGERGAVLDRAMAYVQAGMDPNGYVGGQYESGMYMHAICSLFALSYLGRSAEPEKEKELAAWCRKSIDCILEAQQVRKAAHAQGGWRYKPHTRESDLSVTSWQLLVLHAARQCGYEIDDLVFQRALGYINNAFVQSEAGAGYVYRPGISQSPERAVTGVALFVKHLLEKEADERNAAALAYLQKAPPSWGGPQYNGYFYFATFYIAQGMFQIGGAAWATFAPEIQRILVEHQNEDGSWPLPPDNAPQSRTVGPAYPTAMAILILSLDRQYLPMYQRQKQLF